MMNVAGAITKNEMRNGLLKIEVLNHWNTSAGRAILNNQPPHNGLPGWIWIRPIARAIARPPFPTPPCIFAPIATLWPLAQDK